MEAENRRLYKLLTTDCTGILHEAACQEPEQIVSHSISAAAQGGWHDPPVSIGRECEVLGLEAYVQLFAQADCMVENSPMECISIMDIRRPDLRMHSFGNTG